MGHDDAVSGMCWFDERLYTASWDSTVKVKTKDFDNEGLLCCDLQVEGDVGACFCFYGVFCCPDQEVRVADDVVYSTGLAVRFSQLIQSQEIPVSLTGRVGT